MMNRLLLAIVIAAYGCDLAAAQQTEGNAAEEAAIRKMVESYILAFNQGDAKGVAAHWAEDSQFVTPAGETLQGRAAIQEGFAAFFKENEGIRLEVQVDAIRLEKPDLAVEEGTARVLRPDEPASESSYVATHVKRSGKWEMKSTREAVSAPSHFEQLKQLEWMIGDWVDQDENATVEMTCRWTKNQNFITRSFAVKVADGIDLEGTQVIGWDPAKKVIRSWLFDSDGGFGVSVWKQGDDRWTIQALQVLPDGAKASSVNILKHPDENTFTWRSISREVDGEILPDIEQITVVRKSSGN